MFELRSRIRLQHAALDERQIKAAQTRHQPRRRARVKTRFVAMSEIAEHIRGARILESTRLQPAREGAQILSVRGQRIRGERAAEPEVVQMPVDQRVLARWQFAAVGDGACTNVTHCAHRVENKSGSSLYQ